MGNVKIDGTNSFNNYTQVGILWKDVPSEKEPSKLVRTPVYILETVSTKDPNMQTVAAYAPVIEEVGGELFIRKKYTKVPATTGPQFKDSTVLGRLAILKNQDKIKKVTEDRIDLPLFISKLEYGTDTFTGHIGMGFKEYKSSVNPKESGPTGVFICLDSVKWSHKKADPNKVMEYIKDSGEGGSFGFSL